MNHGLGLIGIAGEQPFAAKNPKVAGVNQGPVMQLGAVLGPLKKGREIEPIG